MAGVAKVWEELVGHVRSLELLVGIGGLLEWDQQTMMPPRGGALRGAQSALISRLCHERLADPKIVRWLDALEGASELLPVQRAAVRNLRREVDRAVRVPADLVEDLALAQSAGFQAWIEAKRTSDFEIFRPHLERILGLVRERAERIDSGRHPYDVTLEEYDPGTSVSALRETFSRLRRGLVELLEAVRGRPRPPRYRESWSIDSQTALHREVAGALGYDFAAGRLDFSEHPFSMGLGPSDVRITTHLVEDNFLLGLGSTVHETGHALYEQGLPEQWAGTSVGRAASFGLHESQSRFWENTIGQSLPFYRWLSRFAGERFGARLDPEELYAAANGIEADLIRIEADEVTYNLHIIVRFQLELALFDGELDVGELPEAWNSLYEEVLGIRPPDAARGVLQDVHWSSGAFGYFPSYTLGNLYAASLGAVMQEQLPTLWDDVEAGRFGGILGWLRTHVHEVGHLHDAPDIVRNAVGERDAVEDLLAHLWARQGALYGVTR